MDIIVSTNGAFEVTNDEFDEILSTMAEFISARDAYSAYLLIDMKQSGAREAIYKFENQDLKDLFTQVIRLNVDYALVWA